MIMLVLLYIIGTFVLCGQAVLQDEYCFGKDAERPQTRHFNTKTAYQNAMGTELDKQYLVPNCIAEKAWILHRHGTRLPSKSLIEKATRLEELRDLIYNNYRVLKTAPAKNALCPEDLIALKMWKWNSSITADMEYYLTSQGYEDLRGTARVYQKYYPRVLKRNYSRLYYSFAHTGSQRTIESFKAFADSLFGKYNSAEAETTPDMDLLLRPYDFCEAWQKNNFDGEGSENYKFRQSDVWQGTLSDISARLGFQYTLEATDIELMYDMCRYDQAWQVDRTSVWCAVFTPAQVDVFEYEEDLKYYYKSGYGYEPNTRLNCRLMQDMLAQLSTNTEPNVAAYFVHSVALQTFITSMGIFKDETPLLADNYTQMLKRKWQTSAIDPFAGNFVAVKYQCDAEPIDKEKVIFYLNQNTVDLDWCHVGLCNWADVLQRYRHFSDMDCSTSYCHSKADRISISIYLLPVLITTAIINLITF